MTRIVFILTILVISQAGVAAPAISAKVIKSGLKSKIAIGYFGDLAGPTIGNFGTNQSENGVEDLNEPIELYNELGFGYRVGKGKFYVKPIWLANPSTSKVDASFEMLDPKIGYSNSKWLRSDKFFMYTSLSAPVPMSDKSKSKFLSFSPGVFQIMNYKLGRSKWSVRSYQWLRFYSYSDRVKLTETNDKGIKVSKVDNNGTQLYKIEKDYKFNFWPGIAYQATDKVELEAFYQFNRKHYPTSEMFTLDDSGSLYTVGAKFKVMKDLEVNPQLRFKELSQLNSDEIQLGMLIEAKLF